MVSNVISNFSSCFIHVSPVPRYPTFNFFRACLWEKNNYEYHQAINLKIFSGRHFSYTTSSPKKITGSITQPRFMDYFCPLGIMGSYSYHHPAPILHKIPNGNRNPEFAEQDLYWESREFPTQPLDAWNFWKPWKMLQRLEFNTQPSKWLKHLWLKHLCTKNGKTLANQKATSLSISLKSVMGFSSQCQALTFQTSSAASFFMETRHLDLGLANRFKYERLEM